MRLTGAVWVALKDLTTIGWGSVVVSFVASSIAIATLLSTTVYEASYARTGVDFFTSKVAELEARQNLILEDIKTVRDAISFAEDSEDLTVGAAIGKIENVDQRLLSVEKTLDIAPREIISIVVLEQRLRDLEADTIETIQGVKDDIDRVYSVFTFSVIALIVAVLASVILTVAGRPIRS